MPSSSPTNRPGRTRAGVVALAAALLLGSALASTPSARADGGSSDRLVRLELSLGAHQLALTVTPPPTGGGRASAVVLTRGSAPFGSVTVAAARPGVPAPAGTRVDTATAGRPTQMALDLPEPGAWEVVVADGDDVARVPLIVAAPAPTPSWVWIFRVAALVGLLALLGAVSPATRGRRRLGRALGALALVGVTVAATTAALGPSAVGAGWPDAGSAATPAAPAGAGGHATHGTAAVPATGATPAAAPTAMPMSSGAVVVTTRLPTPAPPSGAPLDLELDLTDGSTGAPVDDLVVHDEALVHLVVIGPGRELFHLHPVRVAPGRYAVRLSLGTAGVHGVFAEVQRAADGGHQVARTAFAVAGAPPNPPASAPSRQEVAGMQVETTISEPVAGRLARIEVALAEGAAPVRDLQSWLGMAGHLMLLGPGRAGVPDPGDPAAAFAHVHAMGPPGPVRGGYGPRIGFDYTFPLPGRYQLWAQVQRGWTIVTIPIDAEVRAAGAS